MKPMFCNDTVRLIVSLILYLAVSSAAAKDIQLEMPNKLIGIASYHPDNIDKTAILVLHGFLQTRDFSTIQFISNELIDNDYPVLIPTLSLNKNLRRQSLDCDSIHTHNLEDNNLEIKQWIHWLKKQGYQSIILIGHSSGNMQLISFLQNHPDPAIKRFIAISPGTTRNPYKQEQTIKDIQLAKQIAKTSSDNLSKYSLGFCEENYTSTAQNFLSYASWTETDLLIGLKELDIDTHVITGNDDPYVPDDWAEKLRQNNIKVTLIEKKERRILQISLSAKLYTPFTGTGRVLSVWR